VLRGDEEFADRVGGRDALEQGLAVVAGVLRRAGLSPREIRRLAVGTGPGSFTGLRIAVSYAKGLALALRLPLAGVSSYDAMEPPNVMLPAVSVVSGRAGLACARLRLGRPDDIPFVSCGSEIEVAEALAAHLERRPGGEISYYGGVEGVLARLGERGCTVRAHPLPDIPAALLVARIAARRSDSAVAFVSPHAVLPDYG
jgi:tRNA threonylcarbamoyladenosine biosynthesis protein TsaB